MSFRNFKRGWAATVVVVALSLSGPALAIERPKATDRLVDSGIHQVRA